MQCNIGIKSEFEWYFNGKSRSALYGKGSDKVVGVADVYKQQAWVFVDRIVKRSDVLLQVMNDISSTTVHELIHLCGYEEDVAIRGEELLIWGGWSWCYHPLPGGE